MPIYEYLCSACGHQLEAFQKISEAPLTECPACHQQALNKQMSSTSFQLKGTGWYVTDIRDKGKPKPAESSESTGEKKTDTGSSTTDSGTKNSTDGAAK